MIFFVACVHCVLVRLKSNAKGYNIIMIIITIYNEAFLPFYVIWLKFFPLLFLIVAELSSWK